MIGPQPTIDTADGDHHDSGKAQGGRQSLSVAEIQRVLRELRAGGSRPAGAGIGARSQGPEGGTSQQGLARLGDIAAGVGRRATHGAELEAGWIGVLAAHAGAGASTVALVITDAAAANGRRAHLIDMAHPCRSGLVAAASAELGTDVTGEWRRGMRSGVPIDRRATDTAPGRWPVPPVGDDPVLTVVDLGAAADNPTRLAVDRSRPVIVCRPTVPGVRLAEQLLEQLAGQPVVVAAVGLTRWPGEVTASLGPQLRALRAAGLVTPLPVDRRLQVSGLTSSPLPRALRAAGRVLLELLDDAQPGVGLRSSFAVNRPVSTPEETHR